MKNSIILIIASTLFSFHLQAQQAWTKKKGEGYFQIGSSYFQYSTLSSKDFKSVDIARPIAETVVSFYGEYGISDKLMATLILPMHFISSGDLNPEWQGITLEKGNLTNLGNINLAFTYLLHQKNGVVVSSKLAASMNSSEYDETTGLRTGYNAFGISPTILAGIGRSNFFSSAEIGVNILNNDYLNRFIFNAQIGKELGESKKFTGIFNIGINATLSTASDSENDEINGNAAQTALYLNEQAYYSASLKLGYKLATNWALWFAVGGGAGQNIGQNGVYSLALAYKLQKK